MAPRREPIFLGRETYRRRRVIDAMRLLPVAGLLLFFGPLLGSGEGPRSTALAGIYIFAAWLGLIVLAGLLVRWLSRAPGGVAADPLETDLAPPGEAATEAEAAAPERPGK